MMDYARTRAIQVLRDIHGAILATCGPSGPLASQVECEACGLRLYVLLPETSDHLFNLEQNPSVALVAGGWEVCGTARWIPRGTLLPALPELLKTDAEWTAVLEIQPLRLQLKRPNGWGNLETIDIERRKE